MEHNCISYAQANTVVWQSNPIISKLIKSLLDNTEKIDNAIEKQNESNKTGHVTNKNKLVQNLAKDAYKMNRKISLYAKQAGNTILLNDVDITETNLLKLSDSDLLKACTLLVKRGREYFAALAPYGVTEEGLNSIEAEVSAIKKLPADISTVNSEHKTATKMIKQYIADARVILDQLDDAFEGLIDNQTFIDGWFDVRKIKGRHHSKKANGQDDQSEKAVAKE